MLNTYGKSQAQCCNLITSGIEWEVSRSSLASQTNRIIELQAQRETLFPTTVWRERLEKAASIEL